MAKSNISKYLEKFKKINGYVSEHVDFWAPENLIYSSSFGVNWLFGKTHGFPRGYTTLLWGEAKSGKSLLTFDWSGMVHKSDPEALVVKFDTEYRDGAQLTDDQAKMFGIDKSRYHVIQDNKPDIFDTIKNDIQAMCQDGAKIKLIIIDSISGLQGRREATQDSVNQHQIGDHAATIQVGLKSIREMIFKNRIAMILTAHAKDEMNPLEVRRGNVKRPAAASAVKHLSEFFIHVERNRNKDGKKDELEHEFKDDTRKGMDDDGEITAHKTKVWMQGNTLGPENRVAQFTMDRSRGIINQHEEAFILGLKWGVIERVNSITYKIGSETFKGKPAALEALEKRTDLQKTIISAIQAREGTLGAIDIDSSKAIQQLDAFDEENNPDLDALIEEVG